MTEPTDVVMVEKSLTGRRGLRARPILNIVLLLLVLVALVVLAPRLLPTVAARLFPPAPVHSQTIYVGSTLDVTAINALTGIHRWHITLPHQRMIATGDMVIASQGDAVYGRHAQDGSPAWQTVVPQGKVDTLITLFAGPGIILCTYADTSNQTFNSSKGQAMLVALDAHTGKQLWNFTVQTPLIDLNIAVNRVYVLELAPDSTWKLPMSLYALDFATGHQRWRFTCQDSPGVLLSAPASGILVVGGNNRLYGIEQDNGVLRWKQSLNYNLPLGLGQNTLYVSRFNLSTTNTNKQGQTLTAFDVRTGAQRWIKQQSILISDLVTEVDGLFIVGTDLVSGANEALYIDQRTGTQHWLDAVPSNGDPYQRLNVAGNVTNAVVISGSRDVWAISLATGRIISLYSDPTLSEAITTTIPNGVAIADGSLVNEISLAGIAPHELWQAPVQGAVDDLIAAT